MRVRHKPPALVSMWMLDVFCCALGCVTLLFLLNSRMATDAERANRTALLDLQTADKKLAAALTSLEETGLKLLAEEKNRTTLAAKVTELEGIRLKLTEEASELNQQLKVARTEKDDTARKLAVARDETKQAQAMLDSTQLALNAAEKKVDATAKELATAREKVTDATELLKKKQTEIDTLAKKEGDAATRAADLQKRIREKDDERFTLENRVTAMKKELTDLDAKYRATQRELNDNLATTKVAAKNASEELANAKAAAAKTNEELDAARTQIKDLTKKAEDLTKKAEDLAKKAEDSNTTIIDLQGDKAKLADKFNKLQLERESRFAGIAMTGKKAVFVIDMSGSMGKRDLNNLDSGKWPLVIETVCKVMRSVPLLEKYQVIVFSSSANWLFGDGEWQTFSGEKSVEAVNAALTKVKPKDDTNMYAALEKAFSLRDSGLDAIYLFSDGLPTSGAGLTPAQQRANPPLSESELGVILGKHVRDKITQAWNREEFGKPRVKINSIGFYFESSDVGSFLWALSRENDGSFVGMSRP